MRINFITSCLLWAFTLSYFSANGRQSYDLSWIRSYGDGGDDGGKSIIPDRKNGGMWMVGYKQTLGYLKADMWVIKVNDEGRNIWGKTYGGRQWDEARSAVATDDGGLAVVGITESKGNGKSDIWLIKLNATGEVEWEQLFGDRDWDDAFALKITSDSGFIIAGSYTPRRQEGDLWVIKTDHQGVKQWDVRMGGNAWEGAHSVLELPNGNFLVAGHTASESLGKDDGWILNISPKGQVLWDKHYGGAKRDALHSLLLQNDSTVLVAGFTKSKGRGKADLWLINIDLEGKLRWEKTIGGHDFEKARSILRTQDGNLLFAGYTHSQGIGGGDVWIIKTNPLGDILWERTFGGEGFDKAYHMAEMPNADIVLIGNIDLNGQQNILGIRLTPSTQEPDGE